MTNIDRLAPLVAGVTEGERDQTEHKLSACRTVLADRERELLELKGPCLGGPRSDRRCRLHRAHAGPCDIAATKETQ